LRFCGGLREEASVPYPASGSARPGAAGTPLFDHPVYGAPPAGEGEDAAFPGRPEALPSHGSGARPGPADTPFGRLIGQYRNSFLLLEDHWGLVIVDQHVAHERVLYDRIRQQLEGREAASQRLLEPLLVEMDEALAAAVPRVRELLSRVGIEAEPFGPETVRVDAVPVDVDRESVGELLRELLERATTLDGVPERVAEELEEELAAGLSCRAAIKINHPLTPEEQRSLLQDLAETDNPHRCPHGRPIILRLGQEEMERRLGRR